MKLKAYPTTVLQIPTLESEVNLCTCVFGCLQGNMCEPFINLLERKEHSHNTRNNNLSLKFPKMETHFVCKVFCVAAGNAYSKIPVSERQLVSRILFRKLSDDSI